MMPQGATSLTPWLPSNTPLLARTAWLFILQGMAFMILEKKSDIGFQLMPKKIIPIAIYLLVSCGII